MGPAVVGYEQLLSFPMNEVSAQMGDSASLGFDVARLLVENFGGRIEKWRTGSSVIVKILLPLANEYGEETSKRSGASLYVGDEARCSSLATLAGQPSRDWTCVPGEAEAVQALNGPRHYAKVFIEQSITDTTGIQFAKRLRQQHGFSGAVIVLTDAPNVVSDDDAFVVSPWDEDSLVALWR